MSRYKMGGPGKWIDGRMKVRCHNGWENSW